MGEYSIKQWDTIIIGKSSCTVGFLVPFGQSRRPTESRDN